MEKRMSSISHSICCSSFKWAVAWYQFGLVEVLAIKARSDERIQDYLSIWIDNRDFARDVAALSCIEFWPDVVHLAIDGQILRDTTVPDFPRWIKNLFEFQTSAVISSWYWQLFQIYPLLHKAVIIALETAASWSLLSFWTLNLH